MELQKRDCGISMRLVPYGGGWTDVYADFGDGELYFIISNTMGRYGFQTLLGFRNLSLQSLFFCVEGCGQFIDLLLTAAGQTDNKCDKQNYKSEFFHFFPPISLDQPASSQEERLT